MRLTHGPRPSGPPAAVQKTSGVFCAGQLYGAKHGLAALPAEAVYRLDVLEPLLELVGEWGRVRQIEKL